MVETSASINDLKVLYAEMRVYMYIGLKGIRSTIAVNSIAVYLFFFSPFFIRITLPSKKLIYDGECLLGGSTRRIILAPSVSCSR